MYAEETQEQPKTKDALQHTTVAFFGEEIPAQAVLEHSREGRVQCISSADGNASEDLVPESSSKIEETSRSRSGESEIRPS